MNDVIFFKKIKPKYLKDLFPSHPAKEKIKISDIKILQKAKFEDLTFFDSLKYKDYAKITNARCCITTEKLQAYLPNKCIKIISKSVLFDLAKITKIFYPTADVDIPDEKLNIPKKSKFSKVRFGNNVLIGSNVKIGKESIIGSNTIIESNVKIGTKTVIGSNTHIKNSIIGNNVVIQSGNIIGHKGFGFIPLKEKNFKFPHIGRVLIKDNVEIASSCTIDRGSIDDTVIESNTFLDNQVHVAHNVKIGKNCMIAGQVGFAGSSVIGNNVSIGGQAGISGHLTIGNNVKIGGGSGVVKDLEDNQVVMGYPAVPLKEFLKKNNE